MSKKLVSDRKECSVVCPIVYGSQAFYFGKKQNEQATHRWYLYLRSPNNEDLSTFVSKVAFSLHPSFADPVRVITQPPFEVTEMGWGEFEAHIRIYFRDPDEQPLDVLHHIRLYIQQQQGPNVIQVLPQNLKKPVVSETYDEIVFTNPTVKFHGLLMGYVPPATTSTDPKAEHYTVFDEDRDLLLLSQASTHLAQELSIAKSRLAELS